MKYQYEIDVVLRNLTTGNSLLVTVKSKLSDRKLTESELSDAVKSAGQRLSGFCSVEGEIVADTAVGE